MENGVCNRFPDFHHVVPVPKLWLEPVIDPEQALTIAKVMMKLVDFWAVGKINHNPELEAAVDWVKFREDITELFERFGSKYYIKESLREWK